MPDLSKKLKVCLSESQRAELEAVCRRQSVPVANVRRARVLLMSDSDHSDGRRRDWEIAEVLGVSERQVVRIRQQFARQGEIVLDRKPRPSVPGKLDGKAEATLVTLCCSKAPKGCDHWTLQLLCDELARLQVVDSVCPETVRKSLKKTNLNLGEQSGSVSRKKTAPALSLGWKRSLKFTRSRTTSDTR